MLIESYAAAGAAMVAAALYLYFRLRLWLSTASVLLMSLLVIYGPATLVYLLSSGERYFILNVLSGQREGPHPIFMQIQERVPEFQAVLVSLNFSVALTYIGVIAGIESAIRIAPARSAATQTALSCWNSQPLADDTRSPMLLLLAMCALTTFMLHISWHEDHIQTISTFFSIKDNPARDIFRSQLGSSPNYLYRLLLGAVAPLLIIWGALAGILRKSVPLICVACALFVATMIGKLETLSKAPPLLFVLQIGIAALLTYTNRITWKPMLLLSAGCALGIYLAAMFFIIFPEGTSPISAAYSRVFEAESQSLLENFAVFPQVHPHMWGANIRPLAELMGLHFEPAYKIVAQTWYGTGGATSPSLFIADAWADFSFGGVLVSSIIAGVVCRLVDMAFLSRGKSVSGVATLAAAFLGIFTLLTTALNTALLSGGLLLAPMLALLIRDRKHATSFPRGLEHLKA